MLPTYQIFGTVIANALLKAIESRVARIKARVAELTGNMESNTPSRR